MLKNNTIYAEGIQFFKYIQYEVVLQPLKTNCTHYNYKHDTGLVYNNGVR